MLNCDKIFSVPQLQEADAYTVRQGGIASVDLMERAATACLQWIKHNCGLEHRYAVICGQGNNGGDGLAIARLLSQTAGVENVAVYILNYSGHSSSDYAENLQRLKQCISVNIYQINQGADFRLEQPADILIDALIGSGLSAPVTGWLKTVIESINRLHLPVIAIDLPSGMFADTPQLHDAPVLKASQVLSFQFPKLSFFFPEADDYMGDFVVLPIGIAPDYIAQTNTPYYFVTAEAMAKLAPKRRKFSHKGNFGHAMLVAGSYGKMGAALLAAKACLRSGAGLLTAHVPMKGVEVMQTAFPEAMLSVDDRSDIVTFLPTDLSHYNAIGIGPGIGTAPETQQLLRRSLEDLAGKSLVLDADALNILALNKQWLELLPAGTILTPHVKEFERLLGRTFSTGYARLEEARKFAHRYKLLLVLKGAHTAVCTPSGDVYFNSSGNPGMATAGSGDVLTGIIIALLAQGYEPLKAAVLGVYLHGVAGDNAAEKRGWSALIASDIVENL